MKIKSFRFWFTLISILIIMNNMLGWDDKSLLLYFSTPTLWINEWISFGPVGKSSMPIFYAVCLVTWFLAGLLIDMLCSYVLKKMGRK